MIANLAQLTSNEKIFTQGTYNGIAIIKRDRDGFINATAMCNQFNRRFRKIFENYAWQGYFNEFKTQYEAAQPGATSIYELKKGYSREFHGTYVHPKLINYIAIWASPRYAVVVGEIMDTINELAHATGQPFGQTKDQLITQMRAEIQAQQATIAARDDTIAIQETHIAATSVPITNCDKIFTIFAFGGGYKLSANSTNPQRHFIKRFTFPASMNFKQVLKRVLGAYSFEDFENYEDSILRIRAMEPKTEIDGDQVPPVVEAE
jgi:hypothetical protein